MLRNMAVSLLQQEVIRTTLPRARELRRVAEPLITMAAADTLANRRLAFARLRDRAAVRKLFSDLGPRYERRPGGYLRVLKCGFRPGDRAPMALVELVDRPQPELPPEPQPGPGTKAGSGTEGEAGPGSKSAIRGKPPSAA